ncbi:thioredoxin family protein [Desulfonatronovibrio magnus]|uniref:thioredoxin family protein n=1 Tax=Desulfonatronovibrio magnus TaxID=698827 RepID=UPI0005EBD76C|nr:thioredoxin domain-containing protein [Desulfonatronovibrio magnus]
MKKINSLLFFLLVATFITACAPKAPEPVRVEPAPAEVITVNHQTFTREISNYSGSAIVIFYNNQFWQSMDMLRRIEWLASQYGGRAKFAKFHWQVHDDPSRFKLEMLPTVILFRNGYEIDRIKGIPPEESVRRDWNDDIELWFLVNALQLTTDQYSGNFTYFFNNDYTLKIGNY